MVFLKRKFFLFIWILLISFRLVASETPKPLGSKAAVTDTVLTTTSVPKPSENVDANFRVPNVRGACTTDLKLYCNFPDFSKYFPCLIKDTFHRSKTCQKELAYFVQVAPHLSEKLYDTCQSDVLKLCRLQKESFKANYQLLSDCLKVNFDKLSPICKQATESTFR